MHIHHVGHIKRSFLLNNSAVLVRSGGLYMLGHHVHAFHNDPAVLFVYRKDLSFLVLILAGDYLNGVALLNLHH